MGCAPSVALNSRTPSPEPEVEETPQPVREVAKSFVLKHPGHCTGMFWRHRADRVIEGGANSGDDWPRNGAVLKGFVRDVGDKFWWLQVTDWRQSGHKKEWHSECRGLWMPSEQGGLLLHEIHS
ncbi:hypothetical protein DIPPA_11717 [Diplonema papillatum]|nr:hypothetical protein DIPPA_11717 [Diplonema papillatum]|eukprot:gene2033-3111_t